MRGRQPRGGVHGGERTNAPDVIRQRSTVSAINRSVTERGAVNLHGRTLREQGEALISIAHPAFRPELPAAPGRASPHAVVTSDTLHWRISELPECQQVGHAAPSPRDVRDPVRLDEIDRGGGCPDARGPGCRHRRQPRRSGR
ncbi:MAG: hypothetical protein JST54_25985 [Deltaproteobacteria bacterium]|nr:hypothetical protein [Deltaproteobacteria bacterium]